MSNELGFDLGGDKGVILHIDGELHSRALVLQEIHLDERQLKEIKLAMDYAVNYHHGTDGHNKLMLIYLLASALGIRFDNTNNKLNIPQQYVGTIYYPLNVKTFVADEVILDRVRENE